MKTAVDSSALWTIFKAEPEADGWMDVLIRARRETQLVICDVVFAEIAPLFSDRPACEACLAALGIEIDAVGAEAAFLAGRLFKEYRQQGGPREALIPDFLVGAHAACQASGLAAADRGYLRRYFPRLILVAP